MSDKINNFLISKFKDSINSVDGCNALIVNADSWNDISEFIKNNKEMGFDLLMSITSYDLENDSIYGLAYNFYSTKLKHYLEIRIEVNESVEIPSVVHLWRAADWHEREAYDLFGIYFSGHPDLRRLLTDYGFVGHPLRKDFPLVGNSEVSYDIEKDRVVQKPVSIEPRVLVPKVIREED